MEDPTEKDIPPKNEDQDEEAKGKQAKGDLTRSTTEKSIPRSLDSSANESPKAVRPNRASKGSTVHRRPRTLPRQASTPSVPHAQKPLGTPGIIPTAPHIEGLPPFQWEFLNVQNWVVYDLESQVEIEKGFRSGANEVALKHGWAAQDGYTIHFRGIGSAGFIQRNNKNGNFRQVRRIPEGIHNLAFYQRSRTINTPIKTPKKNLVEFPKETASEEISKTPPPPVVGLAESSTLKKEREKPIISKELDFSVADSEMNIVYTETEDKQKTVKCATFSKLIEKLTNSDYIQIDPVLLTYRTYCTPLELLGALLERYEEAGSEETASLIRLKIFNVLRRWIQFGSDFDSEEKVKDTTLEFLSKLLQSEEKTQLAQDMIRRIEKSKKSVIKNSRIGTTGPELLLPSDVNVNVMLFPPEEIARQITISEWKIWEAIKPWEFLDLKWQKPNKKELAPNILAFTERFNYINAWVATTVCLTENFKSRVKIIKRFIDIAMALRQLRNFNGMMEICSGLTRGPVNRLKKTFAALSKNYQNKREELLKITEPQHSYKSLRELICSADPPLVPYLGMYLTDLTFIEEGNKTLLPITVEDKTVLMINYKKSRLVSETLSRIQMYQQKPYELKSFAPLQDKLKNLKVITDENVLYTVSEYLEPRHNQEQPPRPSILDSLIEISLPDYKKNLEFELEVEWLFDEPDAPSNIVFDEAEQIVSATLPKLIEKLTHHETPDVKSQIPFLSNFTYVVSPDELLDLLIERFRVPLPLDQSPQTLDKFEKTIKGPIELRVYNLVKNWVSFFWCDFQREELITKLMDFITSDLLETDKKTAGALQKLLEKKRGGTIEGLLTLPASNNESLNLLAIEPLEIAKQLTLEAYTKVYIPINPRQLVEESMMKSYSVVDSLLKKIDLEAIINKMKSKNGFELKDRRKKKSLKQYPKCFIGQEAVTWLSCQLLISREDAVLLGKHLQEKGVIDHVSSKAEFGDNELFYKFPTKKNSTSLFYDKQTFGFATTPQMGPLRRACMEHLLRIKNWVLFELVNTKNLQFMFQIAKELLKLNNWHSLHSMIAALDEHSKIPKFKDAWEKLSNEDQQFFNTTKEIFLDSESFIQRNIHLVSPSLPSLLALLTSIEQKMEASGPIKFTENLVNVKRLLSIGSVVDSFLGIQTSHPIYEPIPLLQAYLSASHQPVKLQLKK